jgi:hypothetical protein
MFGRRPSQVTLSFGLAERKQFLRVRHQPVELHGRRRGVARGELRAGRQPYALLHRRQRIAVIGVDDRPRQRGACPSAA